MATFSDIPTLSPRLTVAPNQPTSSLARYAGIYARTWTVPDAGTVLPQHAHRFAHLTAITSGAVRVEVEGRDLGEFHTGTFVEVAAEARHTFTTLAPATTIMCLHALPEGEPPVHQEHHLTFEDGPCADCAGCHRPVAA